MADRFLYVGLGNPGKRYELTRHNIGFMVVDLLAQRAGLNFRAGKGQYMIAAPARFTEIEAETICIKPTTYMNLSGLAVQQARHYYQIELSHLFVIVDEFQLPFGKLRMRPHGSAGGHNGMADIIRMVGTDEFPRLRIGIGNATQDSSAGFVLSRFTREEEQELPAIVERAADAALGFAANGIEHAMNTFN